MTQRNWWHSGYEWVARDVDGELITIYDETGNPGYVSDDMYLLDEQDPIIVTACEDMLAFCQSGTLYAAGSSCQYVEVTELGPIADLHGPIVKTCSGRFYKAQWNQSKFDWTPCEPVIPQDNRNLDSFELEIGMSYTRHDIPHGRKLSETIKIEYADESFTRTKTRTYEMPKLPKTEISKHDMSIIDHSDTFLLTDEGGVYDIWDNRIVCRIMLQNQPRKPAI